MVGKGMVAVKVACLLAVCAFASNEDSSNRLAGASRLHELRQHFERSEEVHQRSMDSIMQNMSSHDALEILRQNSKASPQLIALAQTAVAHHRLRASAGSGLNTGISPPRNMGPSDQAKWMVNSLLEEAMKKYDLEALKCRDMYTKQCGLIEEARGGIAASGFKVAACRTHILAAESQISNKEEDLPPAKAALKAHQDECKKQMSALHAKEKMIEGDIETMTKTLQMTNCGTTSLLQTSHRIGNTVGLLRCDHPCGGGASLVSFDHPHLRNHIESLKSHVAQQLLQESFGDLASPGNATDLRRTLVPPSPCSDPAQGMPVPKDKRAAKCTLSGSTSCAKLQERFTGIQSGLGDHKDDIQEQIVQLSTECEKTEETLSRGALKAEQTLKQYQTKLAEGTSCENEAAEDGRLKNEEFKDLSKELEKQKATCSANYQNFENEMCGLKKIRGEIYIKMKGVLKPHIQDCKVSDWVPGECSKSCGGGMQEMTRTIETQPDGGVECLPLKELRRCNEQPCPVDCELGSWSGWSSCSSECGGGVQQRIRDVVRDMKHNGNPCGAVSDAKACNVQSCEADCVLMKWSKWSKCSKACDGGSRTRVRHIKSAATGDGTCPAPDSQEREQHKHCNMQACPKGKDLKTIACSAKMDLILILDGSGSLEKAGWRATKAAAKMIVAALDKTKARVAVLLYSGPKSWPMVKKCWNGGREVDQEFTCKMKWVQHFTSELKQVQNKIDYLDWPKGSTMTSLALYNALAETQLSRSDSQAVVTVITDGKPVSGKRTYKAAKALRKVARLMWVPVMQHAPLRFIRRLASKPWKENVIPATDFMSLRKPEFIDKILADMCGLDVVGAGVPAVSA